ncbi:toprim domain-containing protein [Kitasatospora purpeofusca]|uniref:toprim domain-containing protein n=1 Tax=Kitasatospora purpeofusca TaxID=67352 RepID=UPI00338F39E9
MNARGLGEAASKFGVGYVGSARTGHERSRGMLVIPYFRPAGGDHGVATLRFRCIADECVRDENGEYLAPGRKENHQGHGKYQSLPGDHPRLYNTPALIVPSPYIALSEGEFDTQASELAGVPCVGAQGTSAWRPYFDPALAGYEIVFIIADNDAPGIAAADKRASELPNGKVIILGDEGSDINSFVHSQGAAAYRKALGL